MPGTTATTDTIDWTDVDWREHQRWVQLPGGPVNVVELGSGEQPIVFVHGLSGCWQNWLTQLPAFAASHRVVALDLPGFGASPMPREGVSIAGYARTVDAVLGELGIDAACVVGNSMGGFISAELAITSPQRVERLVLVDAAGLSIYGAYSDRRLGWVRRADRGLAAYGAWLASRSDTLVRRPRIRGQLLGLVVDDISRVPAPLAAEQLRGSGKPAFVDALTDMVGFPIRERLAEIACPTLVVHGDRDKLVPLRDSDVFESLIDDATKIVYEGVGHTPMIEVPARFNADLSAWLRRSRRPARRCRRALRT